MCMCMYVILRTLSDRLLRISAGIRRCSLETMSEIWSSEIVELPDCLERDLLLDIFREDG